MSMPRKPRRPLQGSRGASRSHTGTTRTVGTVLAMVSSSRRKMMSDGVRALWTKTTSASEPRSYRLRVIDMTGVIPLPPERNRYFADGWRAVVKTPKGPSAEMRVPGVIVSCSQFETRPPGWRLTVMPSRWGRVGGVEIV
jgi:hypothetical protein